MQSWQDREPPLQAGGTNWQWFYRKPPFSQSPAELRMSSVLRTILSIFLDKFSGCLLDNIFWTNLECFIRVYCWVLFVNIWILFCHKQKTAPFPTTNATQPGLRYFCIDVTTNKPEMMRQLQNCQSVNHLCWKFAKRPKPFLLLSGQLKIYKVLVRWKSVIPSSRNP